MNNGCQPASRVYQQTLDTLGITGEWVGFNYPQQNALVESVIGTLKQGWLWLEEYDTDDEASALCQRAIAEYNYDPLHSSLAILGPAEFTDRAKQGNVYVTKQNTIEILTHAA